jgi:hypothetical protein
MSPLQKTIVERLKAECAEEIQSLSRAVGNYQELVAEYGRRALLPGNAQRLVAHLREHMPSDNSPAALEAHAAIIAKAQAIVDSPTLQFNAKRAVDAAFTQLEGPVLKLEAAATASLNKILAEMFAAETSFAAGYELPHFDTPITESVKSLLAEVRRHSFADTRKTITGSPIIFPVSRLDLGGLQMLFVGGAGEAGKG